MRYRVLQTFTGPFALGERDDGRLFTGWTSSPPLRSILAEAKLDRTLLPDLARRLKDYFDGKDVAFDDIPVAGDAAFYHQCWRACRRIPRGQTRSYGELASMARSAKAARAAGQAMRNNALPIIVPCHRVVGASGSLHGFGGTCEAGARELRVKQSLLRMEGAG